MYKLLKTEGKARRAEFHTVHGVVQDVYKRQRQNKQNGNHHRYRL